jgi:hypothetical protein
MAKVQQIKDITLEIVAKGNDRMLYIEVAGRRIAKRASGESWIILEPGFTVSGGEPGAYGAITVAYDPDKAQSH